MPNELGQRKGKIKKISSNDPRITKIWLNFLFTLVHIACFWFHKSQNSQNTAKLHLLGLSRQKYTSGCINIHFWAWKLTKHIKFYPKHAGFGLQSPFNRWKAIFLEISSHFLQKMRRKILIFQNRKFEKNAKFWLFKKVV